MPSLFEVLAKVPSSPTALCSIVALAGVQITSHTTLEPAETTTGVLRVVVSPGDVYKRQDLDVLPNPAAPAYSRNNLVLTAATAFNADDILSLEAPGAEVQRCV